MTCSCGRDHTQEEAGSYYVSVIDGPQVGLLLGPFDDHEQALKMVEPTRRKAEEVNSRAVFYGFGTLKMKSSYRMPGRLNHLVMEAAR